MPRADTDSAESLDPVSKTIVVRLSQSLKQDLAIVSIDDGMQIGWSDEQFAKADSPRTEAFEPDSNVTFERLLQ
jgi:hypothetical protein